jgi:hypothetical protein
MGSGDGKEKDVNRTIKLASIVMGVLLALVLALSFAPGSGTRAEGEPPGGRAPSDRARSLARPPVYPEEEVSTAIAHLAVAGSVLRPEESSTVEWAVSQTRHGCIYAVSGDRWVYWNGPIDLPQGATVTNLRVYVYDASAENGEMYFGVVDHWGYTAYAWSGLSSGASGDQYFDIAIPNEVIDYSSYAYLFWWRPRELGSNMMLCGLRIDYFPPGGLGYLPLIRGND